MTLSDDIKAKIQAEYDTWQAGQYAGKSKEERQSKGQFFTPPPLSIKMLEKFDTVKDKDILDPTLGAGGLIAAAVIAGADPTRCHGIELDDKVLSIAKRRLALLGVPPCNLVQGDALDPASYEKLSECSLTVFAAVYMDESKHVHVIVSKKGIPAKAVEFSTRSAANEFLKKLKAKNVKLFKI